jgi:hypothetical protein
VFVLYSEQHTNPTGQGGLIVYRLTATGLTLVGQNLITAAAGSAMELSRDGRFVWQWGDRNNNVLDGVLRVWSTNGYTGNPVLINTVPYPYTNGYPDKDLKGNVQANNLVGALGWDGLVAVDTSAPTSPVINTWFGPSTTFYFDGVTFIPNTNWALVWGFIRIGVTDYHFLMIFDATNPGVLTPTFGFLTGFKVDDVKVLAGRVYCLGRHNTTNLPQLVIY